MTTDPLQRVDRGIWGTIAVVGLIDVIASVVGPFVIAWKTLLVFAGICALLAAAGYFYRHIRRDERIALLFICNVQMVSFAVVSAALSYVAAAAALPSWDARLLAWDAHLGMDWAAWLGFMEAHPYLHLPLRLAYMSLIAQPVVFILILVITGRLEQLRIYIVGTIITVLIAVAMSTICPAAGTGLGSLLDVAKPDGVHPASWASWPIFDGLRDGTYRRLFTPDAEGIVTFPSYHAAAGLLGICVMWPVRYARWVSLIVNGAMIAATPVDGGHYFVDIFAGLVIAALCWKAAAWIVRVELVRSSLAMVTDAPSIVPAGVPEVPVVPGSRQSEPTHHYVRSDVI